MMSPADNYAIYNMTFVVAANVINKVEYYHRHHPKDDKRELKLIVYGDNESVSFRMWKSIFRDNPNMCYEYSTDFPLIPIPAEYTPERYEQYEKVLRKCMAGWAASGDFIWGLYNLAAPGHVPRMHLVLANRHVKRSELGRWAHADPSKSELVRWPQSGRRSLGTPSISFREPSILRWALTREYNSGTVTSSALIGASLRDGGESDGTVSSSVPSSPAELFRDLSWTDSDEFSGPRSVQGSSHVSSSGDRSYAGCSASPSLESCGAHQDPRFISIESLRGLVSNLLDFDPLSRRPVVSSTTFDPLSRRPVVSSTTCASVDYLPFDTLNDSENWCRFQDGFDSYF